MREIEDLVLRSARLARAGDWGPEALAVNRRLAELAPGSAAVVLRLARCLQHEGEFEAARDAYGRLIELGADERTRRIAQHRLAEIRARIAARRVSGRDEAERL
ncbi:MAG: hypothetical protein FJW96_11290, partial [Actinobacteria bacterium]|nr:hypothetical protein [Actinomycetota bacterium]